MITPRRLKQALTWWMKKHVDSGRKLARTIKARCGHLIHLFRQSILRNTYKISPSFRVGNTKGNVFEIWKASDRPIRQVTQKVRSSTLRRCYLRSFRLYKNGGSRARIESYWTKFLQWADSGTREGTIWIYQGERRWSEFINVIVPGFTSG